MRVVGAVALLVFSLVASPVLASTAPQALTIEGGPYSTLDNAPVELDVDLYLPDAIPAPAVVLAHGFGGSKASVSEQAASMRERGFVVLAYSARGFGESTGLISMNAPDFEIADAARIVDYLATRPEVLTTSPGDPVVGFAGGSYGGALALMIAGYDERVDAIAADITWNDLETSLFGQSVVGGADVGVFKQLWSGFFFSAGLVTADGQVTECGRFAPDWCAAYSVAAAQGVLTSEARALMARSSPASITNQIAVPTLLGGGQADSLFPLDQTNANAEQIKTANPSVPLKVVWHAGGHDGGVSEEDRLREMTADWFEAHLAEGAQVSTDFEASQVQGSAFSDREQGSVSTLIAPQYPGVDGTSTISIDVAGPEQSVLAPAGGVPAALSSLPGAGALASLAGSLLSFTLPNQTATFTSEPLDQSVRIVGSPRVRLTIASDARDVTLFASLRTIGPTGQPILPQGLVSPIRLTDIGPQGRTVEVQLPTIVTEVAAGERIAVVVGTTDQAYRMPAGPAVYRIGLADSQVLLPTVAMTELGGGVATWVWPIVGIIVIALIAIAVTILRPNRRQGEQVAALAEVPLACVGLTKRFKGGVTAVHDASFEVPRGAVVGLLGPNGAGKTTTMRMVMGLINPTEGASYVFGEQTYPGAPTLAHIGAFIEGPGFLPHLSGRRNLELYWRASGRRGTDPRFDEVLEISGLGSAIDRKVRTYSQGMRQRLGIAQAMLGMPDLLLLDEPTNGLDPPQIREMREVLRTYAADGRTVVISSHLLSEVEQTCTDVVVMHQGTVYAQGSVAELLAGRSGARLEDVFMEIVGEGHEVVTS
jgi:ABC-2 type transport system ATP-binding protein